MYLGIILNYYFCDGDGNARPTNPVSSTRYETEMALSLYFFRPIFCPKRDTFFYFQKQCFAVVVEAKRNGIVPLMSAGARVYVCVCVWVDRVLVSL